MNVDQTKHANLVSTDPKTSNNELTSGFDFKSNPKAIKESYFSKKKIDSLLLTSTLAELDIICNLLMLASGL